MEDRVVVADEAVVSSDERSAWELEWGLGSRRASGMNKRDAIVRGDGSSSLGC